MPYQTEREDQKRQYGGQRRSRFPIATRIASHVSQLRSASSVQSTYKNSLVFNSTWHRSIHAARRASITTGGGTLALARRSSVNRFGDESASMPGLVSNCQ